MTGDGGLLSSLQGCGGPLHGIEIFKNTHVVHNELSV